MNRRRSTGFWAAGWCGLLATAAALAGCDGEVFVPGGDEGVGAGSGLAPANGGSAGVGAGSGQGGSAPVPSCAPGDGLAELASAEAAPKYVAVDATHVYWSTEDAVRRASLAGGELETIAAGLPLPMGLAVDGDHVYWVHHDDERIVRAPKQGGPLELLADAAASGGAFSMVALDDESVFVRRTAAEIVRVPKQGGAPEVVVTNQEGIGSLALDGASVYYLDAGAIERAPKLGGTPETIVAAELARAGGYTGASQELAVDDARVYWMSSETGRLLSAPKDGGAVLEHASGIELGQGVATDGTFVYWTERSRIGRSTRDGLAATPLVASEQIRPMGLATNENLLFFANYTTTGPVMRVCK